MKKVALGIGLSFFMLASVVAQDRNTLKGPAHKNYKPWKNQKTEKVITTTQVERKGPEAKNYKPWMESEESLASKKVVVTNLPTDRPKGPEAKNAKPWDRSEKNNYSESVKPQIASTDDN